MSQLSKALSKRGAVAAPHLIIQALAGTGKTTTMVEGLKILRGGSPSIVPSEQQAAIWKAIQLSPKHCSVCVAAFNKPIAEELTRRVPKDCDAMTMHSLGFRAVRERFGQVKLSSWRVMDIICSILGRGHENLRRYKMDVLKATEKLVSLCKMTLIVPLEAMCSEIAHDEFRGDLAEIASHYDIDLNGNQAEVFDLVTRVLDRCKDVGRDNQINFDDMIWLPIVLDLPTNEYDLLLVDEAQDLNRCQQALARKVGKRLILCGDSHQAIYGFAGADAESMQRMQIELEATKQGCETLPLTITRRCGRAIVREAQAIVPSFEAHESCPEGSIQHLAFEFEQGKERHGYFSYVNDGDMILCRVNAPLVSECFKFLREGRKANIRGRDVGAGLISTIKKQNATSLLDLKKKLTRWIGFEEQKENRKSRPSESRLIALRDRYDCLMCFVRWEKTVDDVIAKIESMFTDDDTEGIMLSSIHKAKGLEAKRVFLIEPEGATVPHPMARSKWQIEQEWNLRYVAITRAIEELIYVS